MNPRLTRRTLLRRGAAGTAVLTLPGLLAACGGGGDGAAEGELAATLRFSNWQYYMDEDRQTLKDFEAQTGVAVEYFEDIDDNATYFGKIQGSLSQGQSIDRDIIVLTDNSRFPGLMVEQGWLEKLDKAAIPNFENLVDAQQSPPFDPGREYSLPWMSGMSGIFYNEKLTGPVTSIEQLLEDSKLKGKVIMLKEMADSMGVVMLANGDDPAKVTDESFDRAYDRIKAAVDSGQIRQFMGNEYTGPVARGDLAAGLTWSGDIVSLRADNANLRWDVPKDGGMIWTDNMLIPKGGHVLTASTYMNYVYDPKVAAVLAAAITYITPVKGAKEELEKTDPETAANPLIFPDDKTLANVHQFDAVALDNDTYNERWQGLLGG